MSKVPWYKDGLPFQCTGCGKCCTGFPGAVWVSEEEIEKLAALLNLSLDDFSLKYLRSIDGRWSLKEEAGTYACCFLKGNLCTVYQERPKQCRTFPFWPQNLKTPETWQNTAKRCEGIDPKHPLIPLQEIEKHASAHS